MDYIGILGAIAIVIGIGLAVIGLLIGEKVFKHPVLKNQFGAPIIGVVIVVVGAIMGGWPVLYSAVSGTTTPAQSYTPSTYYPTTPSEAYTLASFEITPSCQSAGGLTLNGDKTTYTLPAVAWTTTHTIKTALNATFVQPSMKFLITPQAWAGADATDLAVIYYEYAPLDATVNPTAGGNYYFLTTTSGQRNAVWHNSAWTTTAYGSGSTTMLLTSTATVYLNLTLNTDSCSRIDNTYDPLLSTITFHNADHTWSATYTFSFFITAQEAV